MLLCKNKNQNCIQTNTPSGKGQLIIKQRSADNKYKSLSTSSHVKKKKGNGTKQRIDHVIGS